jgi:copper chaperone
MLQFEVNDMTCGHCIRAITMAVKDVAPEATVDIDLSGHLVRVGGASDAGKIEAAIREAGYTPLQKA